MGLNGNMIIKGCPKANVHPLENSVYFGDRDGIDLNYMYLSSKLFCGIHLREISQEGLTNCLGNIH